MRTEMIDNYEADCVQFLFVVFRLLSERVILHLGKDEVGSSNLPSSSMQKAVAPTSGCFLHLVTFGIRTADLNLSEAKPSGTGITAKARQRYALWQFESAQQLQ